MMNNGNNLLNLYNQMRPDPVSFLARRFNIPQGLNVNDPNAIIQHLLNTGQVTQEQLNNANSMRNNPLIQRLFNK